MSLHTANEMAPYARYMIASQDTEPAIGWSYSFLKDIEKNLGGGETGVRIVDSFFEAAGDTREPLTLACMDLMKTKDVADTMDTFFVDLSADLDEASFSEMSNLRQQAAAFGRVKSSDYSDSARDLVDLTDLITYYSSQSLEKAQDLLSAIDEMILYNRSSKGTGHGLSVYHPYQNKQLYLEKKTAVETSLDFTPGYLTYVEQFTDIWLGDEQADWFEKYSASFHYMEYSKEENGIVRSLSSDKWVKSNDDEISDGLQLSLDPVSEHFDNLGVVYIVCFSDGETVLVLQDYECCAANDPS